MEAKYDILHGVQYASLTPCTMETASVKARNQASIVCTSAMTIDSRIFVDMRPIMSTHGTRLHNVRTGVLWIDSLHRGRARNWHSCSRVVNTSGWGQPLRSACVDATYTLHKMAKAHPVRGKRYTGVLLMVSRDGAEGGERTYCEQRTEPSCFPLCGVRPLIRLRRLPADALDPERPLVTR